MCVYDDESWGFHIDMEDIEYMEDIKDIENIEDVNSKHATNIIMKMIKVSSFTLVFTLVHFIDLYLDYIPYNGQSY